MALLQRFRSIKPGRSYEDLSFNAAAETFLARVSDVIEAYLDKAEGTGKVHPIEEIQSSPGSLRIDMRRVSGTDVLLVNRHYLNKELWYSCYESGAHYFALDETGEWKRRADEHNVGSGDRKSTLALQIIEDIKTEDWELPAEVKRQIIECNGFSVESQLKNPGEYP